jgi:hypothetical protein
MGPRTATTRRRLRAWLGGGHAADVRGALRCPAALRLTSVRVRGRPRSLTAARLLILASMAAAVLDDLLAYLHQWADHFGYGPTIRASASAAAADATRRTLMAVLIRIGIAWLVARADVPRSRAWWALLVIVALTVFGSVVSSAMPATNAPLPAALVLLLVSAANHRRNPRGRRPALAVVPPPAGAHARPHRPRSATSGSQRRERRRRRARR